MAVTYARIHGPVLASLLEAAAPGDCMFDGLLFGEVRRTARQQTLDDAEAHTIEEDVADVLGSISCCSTLSFYDGAGNVQDDKLRQLLAAAPGRLLGWFACRPAGALNPSLREAAVTASLQQWLAANSQQQQQQAQAAPVLFAVFVRDSDHGGATATIRYRLMQPRGPPGTASASSAPAASSGSRGSGMSRQHSGPLVGVPLQTLNLGRSLGQQHHRQAGAGMASAQSVDGSGLAAALQQLPGGAAADLQGQMGGAAAAAAAQVGALEGVCQALLASVGEQAAAQQQGGAAAGGGEQGVAALQAKRQALLRQVQELEARGG